MPKILIAYYSRADKNYVNGTIKNLKIGNTEKVAQIIKNTLNGDLFKIEQEKPYSKYYNECIEEARKDQKSNCRPKLINDVENIDKYDVIYLGYPNYWGTMPMSVFSFLENHDFKGKEIRPFCTHEGSGLGNSLKDIKKLCPNAIINTSFSIYGSKIDSAKEEIESWINNGK